jgi:hypothetical protein
MKVYKEDKDGNVIDRQWYKIKNAKQVLAMDLCSGDKLEIDGIGTLEIFGILYNKDDGKNPYESLEITCGLITNEVIR